MYRPPLHIPQHLWQKLHCYVEAALPYEVTGIGTISKCDDSGFVVTELFLPRQHADICNCHFDQNALNEIIFDLVKDNPARAGELRFRWHSHAMLDAYWSKIDESDIAKSDAPWMVNLVTNRHRQAIARLDTFVAPHIHNLELAVQVDSTTEAVPSLLLQMQCLAEVREKCSFTELRR